MKTKKIFIITGLSGSGKSTAIAAFEDAGYYCVDNMPVELLPKFLDLPMKNDPEILGFAFVMDIRAISFLNRFSSIYSLLKSKGYMPEIIFIEADEDVLLQRSSQTRRHHPVAHDASLIQSIRSEKKKMLPIRRMSHRIINSSDLNVHQLKSEIISIAGKDEEKLLEMKINILSFGFKYGIPLEADLVIDMRFLKNPYFISDLRHQDGESDDVKGFVLSLPETRTFLDKYLSLLDFLIPHYKKEGKAYLTIAVGCTGGRHRSVAIARRIFEHLNTEGFESGIVHRDIDRDIK